MTIFYEIAVKLTLQNAVSGALAVIAKDVLRLEGSFASLAKSIGKFDASGRAVLGGLGVAASGALALGLYKAVEHASKLVHVQQQLIAGGMQQKEIAEATAKAWQMQAQYGVKVAAALSDIGEARYVFGTTEAAIKNIDALEKMKVVLNAMKEGVGTRTTDAIYSMAKAGELKGIQDPEVATKYYEGMTRSIEASRGKITPDAFFQATMYGRLASQGWDKDFYTKYLPAIIQSMRPSSAGTGLMSLSRAVVQGVSGQRQTQAFMDMGLISDPSKLIKGEAGKIFGGWRYGAVAGSDEFVKSPYLWAQKYLVPALEKKFPGQEISAQNPKVIGALGDMFGNRVAAQSIAEMTLQQTRIEREARLNQVSPGFDAVKGLLAKDPDTAMRNFSAAWDGLLTALGGPLVQPAITAMNAVAGAMNGLSRADPATLSLVAKSLALLAGVSAAAGIAVLISALGPAGWLILGIGALAAGLLALSKPIQSMIDGLNKLHDSIAKFVSGIGEWLYKHINYTEGGGGFGPGGMVHHASLGGAAKSFSGAGAAGGSFSSVPGGGGGSGYGAAGTGTGAGVKEVIDAAARRHGVDPRVMYGMIAGESAHTNKYDSNTRGESSWSMFQLNRAGGLGNVFERKTGHDVRDPHSIPEIADFVAGYIASGKSLSPWRGFRGKRDWNPRWGSMGYSPVSPYHGGTKHEIHVHNTTNLDGKKVASNTVKHIVRGMTHPTSAPYHDGRHSWTPPDAGLVNI